MLSDEQVPRTVDVRRSNETAEQLNQDLLALFRLLLSGAGRPAREGHCAPAKRAVGVQHAAVSNVCKLTLATTLSHLYADPSVALASVAERHVTD
jgi:hypothetical protein